MVDRSVGSRVLPPDRVAGEDDQQREQRTGE
jgi:hypothetical protein